MFLLQNLIASEDCKVFELTFQGNHLQFYHLHFQHLHQ